MNQTEIETTNRQVLALTHFSKIKPRLFAALVHRYGSMERIMRADSGSLMMIEGMTTSIANRIAKAKTFLYKADSYLQALSDRDIHVSSHFGEGYLTRLNELNDPPPLLYIRGKLTDNNQKVVALVGTDNASIEGIELTTQVAKKFSKAEVQIVSSLNIGIDAAAHLGAAHGKASSFAILESGFDDIYPEEHLALAIDIAQSGGIISEYPPDVKYSPKNYKQSNRLIAAIPQAVVITEFYKDSDRMLDLLACCAEIGKLCFILIDPIIGAKSDQVTLNKAIDYGALVMVGLDKVDEIILSLV